MLQAPPPSGPRATRTSGRLAPNRAPNRGGIQKRGNTPARVDRDGDVAMGTATASGRGTAIRGSGRSRRHDPIGRRESARSTRTGIDTSALQKTVLKSMGSEEPVHKGPRSSLRGVRGRGKLNETREGQARIRITGWRQSKAAGNPDGGLSDLIAFLERKATHPDAPAGEAVKIKKSRIEGDAVIVTVRSEDSSKITRLNNYTFAGATLHIENLSGKLDPVEKGKDPETPNTINVLKSVLSRRYDVDLKLLDLSQLGGDPELLNLGMFNTASRESKFFPALMKICDNIFTTPHQKEDAIVSVSLASNSLPNISSVTVLAQTFPAIRNLDLSNNQFKDLAALEGWRWKFRKLDHLILSGNSLETGIPTYKNDLLKWFPSLTTLNGNQIRSPEQVKSAANGRLPLPILPASFRDEASIGETFVKQFFSAYDGDRASLIGAYYDAQSTFSLSINTSAPRAPNTADQKAPGWEAYIKRSRNLLKIEHLPAKMSRLYTGTDSIKECFITLPATRHPGLLAEPQKWCIECHAIPGLPDAQAPSGVGGLIVMVHGQFSEVDISTGQTTVTRSFDRTFVLGPGNGVGGIRVACDTLVLRSYGGHEAWQPEVGSAAGVVQSQPQATYQIPLPAGYAIAGQGKTEEALQKEMLVLELSKGTGMTLEYSQMCLEQSVWNLEGAAIAFQQAKPNLPTDAFVST